MNRSKPPAHGSSHGNRQASGGGQKSGGRSGQNAGQGQERRGGEKSHNATPRKGGSGKPPHRNASQGKFAGARKPQVTVRSASDRYWLYSWHAVLPALANPERQIIRLFATDAALEKLKQHPEASAYLSLVQFATPEMFQHFLSPDAVHQGIAIEVKPLPEQGIEVLQNNAAKGPVLLLDQVTDPHNVGAILRSAAAFDCPAIIVPAHHSAPETGIIARAAAGALETVPLIRVPNLSRAMLALKSQGYWIAGLDADAKDYVHTAKLPEKLALVLGAEGKGMRRLTTDHCDMMLKLPMTERMESLNVSNAAAIAMYEVFKRHTG